MNHPLTRSHQYCQTLAKNSGSNFYYGMLLIPNQQKRQALFSIYAWMREIDDIADGEQPLEKKTLQLNQLYQQTEHFLTAESSENTDTFWLALRETVQTYQIPLCHFYDMLQGQLQSTQEIHFHHFDDLYQYCYRVASTVGLICLKIWGTKTEAHVSKLAEYCGIALQLTNILRDIHTDALQGKVFIPHDFARLSPEIILTQPTAPAVQQAILSLITLTEHYYQQSRTLEQYIETDSIFSMMMMTEFYRALFKKIKKNPMVTLQPTPLRLSRLKKISIYATCRLREKFLRHSL